jgi:hypothetical protein
MNPHVINKSFGKIEIGLGVFCKGSFSKMKYIFSKYSKYTMMKFFYQVLVNIFKHVW